MQGAFVPEENHNIQISMDGRGHWMDNVFVKRLWRSFKDEEVYLKAYERVPETRRPIDSCFRFFNKERRQSSPGKRTPDNEFYNTLPLQTAADSGPEIPLESPSSFPEPLV